MDEILKAYNEYEEAVQFFWSQNNRDKTWNGQPRKKLETARENFINAVKNSDVRDMFDSYADEVYRS